LFVLNLCLLFTAQKYLLPDQFIQVFDLNPESIVQKGHSSIGPGSFHIYWNLMGFPLVENKTASRNGIGLAADV
jgi:hypothetical protein